MSSMVKTATYRELDQIARIHKKAFPDHFLGKFPVFVIRRFYSFFLDVIFLVSLSDETPSGFVMGGRAEDISLRKNAFLHRSMGVIILGVLLSPAVWSECFFRLLQFVRIKTRRNRLAINNNAKHEPDSIRLLSIAVSPDKKGSGTAQVLLSAFEEHIPNQITVYGLSVKKNNERAISFYKKMGFEVEKEEGQSLYLSKKILKRD